MVRSPENWIRHYHGSPDNIRLARKYSFSDRCRYYLPERVVKDKVANCIDDYIYAKGVNILC